MIVAKTRVQFNENYRFLRNEDSVVLGNILNGLWIKCPSYVYDFLDSCIKKQYTNEQILEECQDSDTKKYINKMLQTLFDMGLIDINDNKYLSGSKINHITIELTSGCNLRCSHCCAECGEIPREDFDIDSLKKVISWCERNKINNIALTGGEIFIRKDIWDILTYIKNNYSGKVELMTNGTLIQVKMISTLVNLVDSISISIDGYDEQSTTKIRGKGVYAKVINSIKELQKASFKKISLSMVLTKETIKHKEEFRKMCSELNVEPVIRVFTPEGRANNNYELLSPELRNKNQNVTVENVNLHQNNVNYKCICNQSSKLFICCNGDIYMCFLAKKPENLLGTIDDLFAGKLQSSKLTPVVDNIEHCKNCNVRYFCASACPGHDSAIYTIDNYRSELCKNSLEYFRTVVWQ